MLINNIFPSASIRQVSKTRGLTQMQDFSPLSHVAHYHMRLCIVTDGNVGKQTILFKLKFLRPHYYHWYCWNIFWSYLDFTSLLSPNYSPILRKKNYKTATSLGLSNINYASPTSCSACDTVHLCMSWQLLLVGVLHDSDLLNSTWTSPLGAQKTLFRYADGMTACAAVYTLNIWIYAQTSEQFIIMHSDCERMWYPVGFFCL